MILQLQLMKLMKPARWRLNMGHLFCLSSDANSFIVLDIRIAFIEIYSSFIHYSNQLSDKGKLPTKNRQASTLPKSPAFALKNRKRRRPDEEKTEAKVRKERPVL